VVLSDNLQTIKEFFPATWAMYKRVGENLDHKLTRVISNKEKKLLNLAIEKDPGLFIHNNENPIQEAEKIIEQQEVEPRSDIIFYGIGMGYHIDAFVKKYPGLAFSIYEPVPEVFYQFISNRELRKLPLKSIKKIFIETRPGDAGRFSFGFMNEARNSIVVIELPAYKKAFPEKHQQFFFEFENAVKERRNSIVTNLAFEKRWIINSMLNFKEVLSTPDILIEKRGEFKDKPALIVAAGPSLEEEFENIRHIKEHGLAYIFSVGSAISPLIRNNIYPDAAFTYDPKKENQLVFKELLEKGINTIPLIFGSTTGYETVENYSGPKTHMIISQDKVSSFYLKSKFKREIEIINDAPSIAAVTLQVLVKLGFNPIILAGQNLAFKDKQQYARGISHHPANASDEQLNKALAIKDAEGNEILSSPDFNRMRQQIEMYIKLYKDFTIINSSRGGAHVAGTIFKPLEEVIREELHDKVVDDTWFKSEQSSYNMEFLTAQFHAMNNAYGELDELLNNIKELLREISRLANARNFEQIDRKYAQFNEAFKNLKENQFFKTFIMPMNRVQAEFLRLEINDISEEAEPFLKAKKMTQHFGKFILECEKDIQEISPVFNAMNESINYFIAYERKIPVSHGKSISKSGTAIKIPSQSLLTFLENTGKNPDIIIFHDLKKLLARQYAGGGFNRMDIIVRYMAIEEYFGENNCGYELFSKMQKMRGQKEHSLERFKQLIRSFAKNRLMDKNPITVNENLQLIDGSHRIACALYFDIKKIPIKFELNQGVNPYSLNWFQNNGFLRHEIEFIEKKFNEISRKLGLYFLVILWPPVQVYFEEITLELEKDYPIIGQKDYCFENELEFASFVKGVYAIDDIAAWKIRKKLEYMNNYDKKFRLISILINNPAFRKKANGKSISRQVEKIKNEYRKRYSSRIDNYFYDIIMHMGDNYAHTEHILQVADKDINVQEFLNSINDMNYVLAKVDVPYMPDNFPHDYPLNKDLDLLCTPEDFTFICNKAEDFASQYQDRYQINKHYDDGKELIRFELNNFLCYQIDIRCKADDIEKFDLSGAVSRRKKLRGFYVPDIKDEILLRLREYEKKPGKTQHLEFIKKNARYLNSAQQKRLFQLEQGLNHDFPPEEEKESILGKRYANDGKTVIRLDYKQIIAKKQVETKMRRRVYTYENVDCCICGGNKFERLSSKERNGLYMPVSICKNCGLIQSNPRLEQKSINDFYNLEFNKLFRSSFEPEQYFRAQYHRGELVYQYINKNDSLFKKKARLFVIEVGCSSGGILKYFADQGHQVKGVDLGQEFIDFGKNRYGLDLLAGDISIIPPETEADLIIYRHVMEHILDPLEELEQIKARLAPDGLLYIEVPGVKNLHNTYNADFLYYLMLSHAYHFTLTTLTNLLARNGFCILSGNENIQSVFKKSAYANEIPDYRNDYDQVISLLLELENKNTEHPDIKEGYYAT
jgi:SAM-dependent methyltransferase